MTRHLLPLFLFWLSSPCVITVFPVLAVPAAADTAVNEVLILHHSHVDIGRA